MGLDFNTLKEALFAALGVIWVGAVAKRWRKDLHEFRDPEDRAARIAIGFYWAITVYVLVLLFSFARTIIARLHGVADILQQ